MTRNSGRTRLGRSRLLCSGMNEEFAEMQTMAEANRIECIEEVLRDANFVDANRAERCVKAGKEMYGVLVRYTNSEALTIVKSVSEMDGVRAWARLHANYNRRTLGRMFKSATRVHVSEACEEMLAKSVIGNHAMGGEVGGVWIDGNVEEMEDEEVSDAFSEYGADQRDELIKIRADQRDGLSNIRAEQRGRVQQNSCGSA